MVDYFNSHVAFYLIVTKYPDFTQRPQMLLQHQTYAHKKSLSIYKVSVK